jgi:uncharacterized delta-60 repeat protein
MNQQSDNSNLPRTAGFPDRSFGDDGAISIGGRGTANAIASDKDGNLYVAYAIDKKMRLARYLVDGARDESFQETTWQYDQYDETRPTRLLLEEGSGKIIVIGESFKNNLTRPAVTRFNQNGSPDLVFGNRVISIDAETDINWVRVKLVDGCLQKDGKILIAANFQIISSSPLNRLYRLQNSGQPDETFGDGAGFIDINLQGFPSNVCNVATQADGKIVVAGHQHVNLLRRVARYHTTGTLDLTFGRGGYADIELAEEPLPEKQEPNTFTVSLVSRIVIQNDDKILVAGVGRDANKRERGLLTRLEANGEALDPAFNSGKPLLISRSEDRISFNSIAVQPDQKIVTVGSSLLAHTWMVEYQRFSENGVIEPFWSGYRVGDCIDVVIQPKGRVVVAGSSSDKFGSPRICGFLGS